MSRFKAALLLASAVGTLANCSAAPEDVATTSSALVLPNWVVMPSPNTPNDNANPLTATLVTSSGDAWSVGYSRVTGATQFRAFALHLVSGSWQIVNTANIASTDDTRFAAISGTGPTDLWSVGSDWPGGDLQTQHGLSEHFDGHAWTRVPVAVNEPGQSTLTGVSSVSATNVWTVGYSRDTNGYFHPLIEFWNGGNWTLVNGAAFPNTGFDRLEAVLALASNDVWVLGSSGRHPKPVFEHWDGSAWTIVPQAASGFDSIMYGIAAAAPNDIWAVGSQGAEHWDGTTWTLTPLSTLLTGVVALASNDVWAVGGTSTLHFDGSTWTNVPNPAKALDTTGTAPSLLSAISGLENGPLFAVGSRDNGRGSLVLEH
jgi:hypothetical protein